MQNLCPYIWYVNVVLQLYVQHFSNGMSLNGSKVLWIALIAMTIFESDLIRSVFQAIFQPSNDHLLVCLSNPSKYSMVSSQ